VPDAGGAALYTDKAFRIPLVLLFAEGTPQAEADLPKLRRALGAARDPDPGAALDPLRGAGAAGEPSGPPRRAPRARTRRAV